MTEIAVLGVDLGKNSCSVVGLDRAGRVVLRRRLHRDGVVRLAAGSPGCVVAMEACCGVRNPVDCDQRFRSIVITGSGGR